MSYQEAESIFANKGFRNVELVKGNIFETLSKYLDRNPSCRIAMLHLDMGIKEPTKYALDLLFSRVVKGGLILFDDYSTVKGATVVVDEFVKNNNLAI